MPRRRRALRIVMWTGGLLSVLIAAALVLSFQCGVAYNWRTAAASPSASRPLASAWVIKGCFGFLIDNERPDPITNEGWYVERLYPHWPPGRHAIWPER